MGKKQTDEWKSKAEELIRAGGDYKSVNEALLQEHKSGIGSSTFRRFKAAIHPEDARRGALQTLSDRKENQKNKPKSKIWNKTKQTEADTSVFADVINDALFYLIPCPQKGMTLEQVKQINLGGGIVGIVTYYTDINLNHPVIILVTRTIMLVLKIRNMCYKIQEKYSELKDKAKNTLPGQGSVGSMQ